MASEEQANTARRTYGSKLMKQGVHAIGVEEGKQYGKEGWVVVAHIAPDAKAGLPASLSFSTKKEEVEVPIVVARSEPFKLE